MLGGCGACLQHLIVFTFGRLVFPIWVLMRCQFVFDRDDARCQIGLQGEKSRFALGLWRFGLGFQRAAPVFVQSSYPHNNRSRLD